MKPILIALVCLVFTACATVRPDASILETAEQAIQAAEAVGGDEFAPVEMRFARAKLKSARKGMEKEKYEVAVYLVDESEINSELAMEKSRTAKLRRRVNELRKSNAELDERLRMTFGDEYR